MAQDSTERDAATANAVFCDVVNDVSWAKRSRTPKPDDLGSRMMLYLEHI